MKEFGQQHEVDLLHGPEYFRYWSFDGQKVTHSFTIPRDFISQVNSGSNLHSAFREEIYRVIDVLKRNKSFFDSLALDWKEYSFSEKVNILIRTQISSGSELVDLMRTYPWVRIFYNLMYCDTDANRFNRTTGFITGPMNISLIEAHISILLRLVIIATMEDK